jgi:hypothetical protein
MLVNVCFVHDLIFFLLFWPSLTPCYCRLRQGSGVPGRSHFQPFTNVQPEIRPEVTRKMQRTCEPRITRISRMGKHRSKRRKRSFPLGQSLEDFVVFVASVRGLSRRTGDVGSLGKSRHTREGRVIARCRATSFEARGAASLNWNQRLSRTTLPSGTRGGRRGTLTR